MYSATGSYTLNENFDFNPGSLGIDKDELKKQSDEQGGSEKNQENTQTKSGGKVRTEDTKEVVNIKKESLTEKTYEDTTDISKLEKTNKVIKKKTKQMKDSFSLSEQNLNPFNVYDSDTLVTYFPHYLENTSNMTFGNYLGTFLTFKTSEKINEKEMLINFPSGYNCGIILENKKVKPFIGAFLGDDESKLFKLDDYPSYEDEILPNTTYRMFVEFDMTIPGETKIMISLRNLLNNNDILKRKSSNLQNINLSGYTTNNENICVGQQVPWESDAFTCKCNSFSGTINSVKITRSDNPFTDDQVIKLIETGDSKISIDYAPDQEITFDISLGAKNDSFSEFVIEKDMLINKIIFEYKSGGITCGSGVNLSRFGCGSKMLALVLTSINNKHLLPNKNIKGYKRLDIDATHWYEIEGIDNSSPSLIWELEKPMEIRSDTYKIWYCEDLTKYTDEDNSGTVNYKLTIFGKENKKKSGCDILKNLANEPSIPSNCTKVPIGYPESGQIKCCKEGKEPVIDKFITRQTAAYLENGYHKTEMVKDKLACQKKCEDDEECLGYQFYKNGSCSLKTKWDDNKDLFNFFRPSSDKLCKGNCNDWSSGIKFIHKSTCKSDMQTQCSLYGNPNMESCDSECLNLYVKSLGLKCPNCGDHKVAATIGQRDLFKEKVPDFGNVGGRGFNIIILNKYYVTKNIAQFDTHGDNSASNLMVSWLDENAEAGDTIIFTVWDEAVHKLKISDRTELVKKYGILNNNILTTGDKGGSFEDSSSFNEYLRKQPIPFYIERTGSNYPNTHKKIIYKRLTPINDVDMYKLLHTDWFNENKGVKNKFKQDYKLYSNYDDAKNDRNEWTFCNFNDPGIGFPRDCGPKGYVAWTWQSKTRGGIKNWEWRLINDKLINLQYRSPYAAIVKLNIDPKLNIVKEQVHPPYTKPSELTYKCFVPKNYPVTIFDSDSIFYSLRSIKYVRPIPEIFMKTYILTPKEFMEYNTIALYGSEGCCGLLIGLKQGKVFIGDICNNLYVIGTTLLEKNKEYSLEYYYNKTTKTCKIIIDGVTEIFEENIEFNIPGGLLTIGSSCHNEDKYTWGKPREIDCKGLDKVGKVCFQKPITTSSLVKSESLIIVGDNYLNLKRNNLIREFVITKSYKMEITIHPTGKIGGWSNIIHSTLSGNCCSSKDRLPGIWFHGNSTRLHIRTSTMTTGNDGFDPPPHLPLNKDTKVVIIVNSNKLYIKMSGGVNYSHEKVINTNRQSGKVKFYASDPWYNASIAKIKNVKWDNLTSGSINVERVHYGDNCGTHVNNGSSLSHAKSSCDKKSTCSYRIDHNIIGDPAGGCSKTYNLSYNCGNGPSKFVSTGNEASGRTIYLDCSDATSYNTKSCVEGNCNKIDEYCKKEKGHLATKEELSSWISSDFGNKIKKYGVSSTIIDGKRWIDGKEFSIDGCCDDKDRYFVCAKNEDELFDNSCPPGDIACEKEREQNSIIGNLEPPISNTWLDGEIKEIIIYDRYVDDLDNFVGEDLDTTDIGLDNENLQNFEKDVKCEDLCDLGIKGDKDSSWLCQTSRPLSDMRCCRVEEGQWCPITNSTQNLDVGNITMEPSGSNRCCCGDVLIDEDIDTMEATKEERTLSTESAFESLKTTELIYSEKSSQKVIYLDGDGKPVTTTIVVKTSPIEDNGSIVNNKIVPIIQEEEKQLPANANEVIKKADTSVDKAQPLESDEKDTSESIKTEDTTKKASGIGINLILLIILFIVIYFIFKK